MPLLASSGDDAVKIWNPSQDQQPVVARHAHPVNCVRWNHTNAVVASAGEDGRLSLHHTTGATIGSIPEEGAGKGGALPSISSICFSKGSRYLASGGASKEVNVWDLKRKVCVKSLAGHTAPITSVIYAAGDQFIASASTAGDVILHSQISGSRAAQLASPDARSVRGLHFSPFHKQMLAGASEDGSLLLWDTAAKVLKTSFPRRHAAPATCTVFSPTDPNLLMSSGLDKRLLLLDVTDRKVVATYEVDAPLTALSCKSDGYTVAVGTSTGRVLLFDTRMGGKAGPMQVLQAHGPQSVSSLSWQLPPAAADPATPSAASTPGTAPRGGAAVRTPMATPGTGAGGGGVGPISPLGAVTPAATARPLAGGAGAGAGGATTPAQQQTPSSSLRTPTREAGPAASTSSAGSAAMAAAAEAAAATAAEAAARPELPVSLGGPTRGPLARAAPPARMRGGAGSGLPGAGAGGAGGGAGAGSPTFDMVQAAVEEGMSVVREAVHEDIQNLHLELLRQFHLQQMEFSEMLQGLADAQTSVAEEVAALRKEVGKGSH